MVNSPIRPAKPVYVVPVLDEDLTPAGGAPYTEDEAAAADPIGNAQILVATNAPANRVADGDNVAAIGTRKGELRVVAKQVDENYADLTYATANLTSRILSAAASTNATSAKASLGTLFAIQGYNASASLRYLKLYNKASAPTVGTDTPVKTIPLPPTSGFAFDWPTGFAFSTGIAYALTTGVADNDTGALTAADILGLNVDYA